MSVLTQNIINSHTALVFDVMNSVTQSCVTNNYNIAELKFTDIENSNIVVDYTLYQYSDVDINCIQSATGTTCASTAIDQAIAQSAESISKRFSLTETETTNITNLLISYTQDVTNALLNECYANSYNQSTVSFEDVSGSEVILNLDWTQSSKSALACSQEAVLNTTSYTQLRQTVDQYASSQVSGIIGPSVFLFIIIVAALAVLIFYGGKIFKAILIALAIIAGGFLIYILVAFFVGWFPFNNKEENPEELPSQSY